MSIKNNIKLGQKTYDSLKKSIMAGDFYPGQKIVEHDIAQLFKVSRTPVREALQRLESEHLVRKSPKGGVIITKLGAREVSQLYAIRIELEVLGVKWAIQNIRPAEIRRLRQHIARMEEYGEKNEWEKSALFNTRFHEAIVKASDCDLLPTLLGILKTPIHQAIARGLRMKGASADSVREHGEIVDAIENKDAALASALLKKHLEQSCANVLTQIS